MGWLEEVENFDWEGRGRLALALGLVDLLSVFMGESSIGSCYTCT